jgi:hypothetical protein
MRHERHYTIDEARELRAWVAECVRSARSALDVVTSEKARAAVDGLDPDAGGGWPGRPIAEATLVLQRAIAHLQAADIVVRDLMNGLVDFPAVRDGEEVYLCWLVDEPDIGWWHGIDTGFAGRRRLPGA